MNRHAASLLGIAIFFVSAGRFAVAQTADTIARAPGTTVTGIVFDSIASAPLSGATVQLVGASNSARAARTTISDSLGRFTLDSVPPGQYSLGFFDPVLESLGIDPPLRELSISGERRLRSDLAIPSPGRFRQAVCGSTTSPPGAVVVGIVRDARDLSAVGGATVTGEWLELTFTHQGMVRNVPRLTATTADNGWFAMCDVPSPGTIILRANRSADSVDVMEVQVPANGVLREEFYLGPAPALSTTRPADSASPPSQRLRTGDGHLSGTVVAAEGGRPLPGARVGIVSGPQTRANERGEWTLGNAPPGTRMLDVRAVGYYPERRAVNVIVGAPPVNVALSTLRAVLDTIKVSASRLAYDRSGFQDRRRTGAGRYLAAEDIARREGVFTSGIFRTVPGIAVERDSNGTAIIAMRGPFGYCSPTIFLDGMRMPAFTGDDIDDWISPKDVAGIEIYSESNAPAQFRDLTKMDVCGSIVIWRK